jgi:long-chain fatty acid transport protein
VEQSASGIGNALSGATAGNDDPSTIFFNPAALTRQEGRAATLGFHSINPQFDFDNEGSTYPMLGMPVMGGNGGNGGERAFVPNAYYAQDAGENLRFGIGITAPYGLTTEYDSDWVGRYHGIKTELMTININPVVAWKVNDVLSLAGGVSAEYVEAELTSAIDFGGILAARGVPGAMPQMLDGEAKIEGDDWGYGFNLAILLEPSESSRIGLNYRSEVEHRLDGDASFEVPTPALPLTAAGLFVDTSGEADLDLPQVASLGMAQKLGESFELLIDIAWTGWSSFEELRVEYGSNQPDSVTEENWDDTWRYAIGLNYYYNEAWTFRAGTAYDETPIPDAEHRTPRIPDGDRLWLSLGAGYQATENLTIDAAYTFLQFNDTDVDIIGATGDNLVGSYEGTANIGSIQATLTF